MGSKDVLGCGLYWIVESLFLWQTNWHSYLCTYPKSNAPIYSVKIVSELQLHCLLYLFVCRIRKILSIQDFSMTPDNWIRSQTEATCQCHDLSTERLLLEINSLSLGALTCPTVVSQRLGPFFRLQQELFKGGGMGPRDRDMEASRYGAENWQGWIWISCCPF